MLPRVLIRAGIMLTLAGCVAITSGCARTSESGVELRRAVPVPVTRAARARLQNADRADEADAESLLEHLRFIGDLESTDETVWRELYDTAVAERGISPGPDKELRVALALATVKRPMPDLITARDTLAALVEQVGSLPPHLHRLARTQLSEVDRRIELREQLKQAQRTLEQSEADLELQSVKLEQRSAQCDGVETEQQDTELELRRLRALKDDKDVELAKCGDALAEAEEKLRAVTTIEKSIDKTNGKGATP